MSESSDREIVITRELDAPRELVFAAWTDPAHVEKWWGPKGFESSGCEIDLREGGVFRLQMRGPDGTIYPCKGIFREVVAPERIVYAGVSDDYEGCGAGLPPRATVTVTFTERGRKTTLAIHTLLGSAADRSAAEKAGFNPGWEQTLDRLAELLAPA